MLHELNCRYPFTRGSVRPIPDADSAAQLALRAAHRCVIFIHGFANTPWKAEKSYAWKQAQLAAAFASADGPDVRTEYFAFHWPGDHPHKSENILTFSARVGTAAAAGQALATGLLLAWRPRGDLVLVAHSLGCRVALACVSTMATFIAAGAAPDGPRLTAVILMAGAVPVDECAPGNPVFGDRYPETWYTNLFSPRDKALKGFVVGQHGVDRAAEAIGLHGHPWPGRWDGRLNTELDHGQYWESTVTGEAAASGAGPVQTKELRERPPAQQELAEAGLRSAQLRGSCGV